MPAIKLYSNSYRLMEQKVSWNIWKWHGCCNIIGIVIENCPKYVVRKSETTCSSSLRTSFKIWTSQLWSVSTALHLHSCHFIHNLNFCRRKKMISTWKQLPWEYNMTGESKSDSSATIWQHHLLSIGFSKVSTRSKLALNYQFAQFTLYIPTIIEFKAAKLIQRANKDKPSTPSGLRPITRQTILETTITDTTIEQISHPSDQSRSS